jgi:predicted AlkP superfamily phosphohydrolase/phosphomutase
LDARVGALLAEVDRDRTAVWVVSASGMQRLAGTFCLNDWLIRAGLLVLKAAPAAPERFDLAMVDWARTRAWSVGGKSGRIYLNVVDREPQGVVAATEYDALCAGLIEQLEALEGPDGTPPANRVVQPHACYERVEGIAPDLIVLAGGQRWRVAETVGHVADWVREADVGPEEAVSDRLGLHILAYPGAPGERNDASVYDVLPTVLQLLEISMPRGLRGSGLIAR